LIVRCAETTIFVIDDDAGMRKSLAVLLDKSGYSTKTFASAEAFLANVETSEPHRGCVVLDIHLEGMSGVELASRLARTGYALPIIFMTGKDSDMERRAALKPNCMAYLTKPFSAALLLDAIDRALTN
jgi:FixJ family two-component response regulator